MAAAGAVPRLSVRSGGHFRKEKGRYDGCRPVRHALPPRKWLLPDGSAVQAAQRCPKAAASSEKIMVFNLRWIL